jgi:hypothetical protein
MKNSGVIFNGTKLEVLKPVLDKWIAIVEEYSAAFGKEDACWWYNERANVGILAAAAWKTEGWLSLEEYATTKRGEKGKYKGRCDLYVAKKTDRKISFDIEAKAAWQCMEEAGNGEIKRQLAEAKNDVERLRTDTAENRVEACFVMPWLYSKNKNDDPTEKLEKWLKCVRKSILCDADAIAWVFPEESRQLWLENYFYPGVVLILRQHPY